MEESVDLLDRFSIFEIEKGLPIPEFHHGSFDDWNLCRRDGHDRGDVSDGWF